MSIPTVYHQEAPPAVKTAALRVIGAMEQEDVLTAPYITSDCALRRNVVVAEMFRSVLRGMRADDEPAVRKGAVAFAQRLCRVISPTCSQPASVGDADVAALLDAKARFRDLIAQLVEHPEKAVSELQALGICGPEPSDIVYFFRENVDLYKTAVGRFVCRHDDVS